MFSLKHKNTSTRRQSLKYNVQASILREKYSLLTNNQNWIFLTYNLSFKLCLSSKFSIIHVSLNMTQIMIVFTFFSVFFFLLVKCRKCELRLNENMFKTFSLISFCTLTVFDYYQERKYCLESRKLYCQETLRS